MERDLCIGILPIITPSNLFVILLAVTTNV